MTTGAGEAAGVVDSSSDSLISEAECCNGLSSNIEGDGMLAVSIVLSSRHQIMSTGGFSII